MVSGQKRRRRTPDSRLDRIHPDRSRNREWSTPPRCQWRSLLLILGRRSQVRYPLECCVSGRSGGLQNPMRGRRTGIWRSAVRASPPRVCGSASVSRSTHTLWRARPLWATRALSHQRPGQPGEKRRPRRTFPTPYRWRGVARSPGSALLGNSHRANRKAFPGSG